MNKSLLILTFCLLFFACEEDDYTEVELSDRVVSSFNGMIVDENGQPLPGVRVSIENDFSVTGNSGTFIFTNVDVPRSNAFLRATKEGFFNGSRTVQAIPNKQNTIRIMLLEKEVVGSFDSGTGGEVSMENGARVSLPADAVVRTDGHDYTGIVKVYLKHLNPIDADMSEQMPGNLIGIDGAGEEMVLESYGMIAAELQSESGEVLQIRSSIKAEIKIPLDDSLQESAPPTISLWYFDETTGLWQEEGSAQYDGDYYVGSVSHFSFWNCDIPFDFVILSVPLTIDGIAASGLPVQLRRLAIPGYPLAIGYTNNEGDAYGKVPANELLEMTIYDQCQEEILVTTIGPFSSDHTLQTVNIGDPESTSSLKGTALDCDGNTLVSGFIGVRMGDYEFNYLIEDGNFEIPLFTCSDYDSIEVRIFDYESFLESGWISFQFVSGTMNLGNILTCQDLTQYITVNIAETRQILIHEVAAGHGIAPDLQQFGINSFVQAKLFDVNNNQLIWINLFVVGGDEMVSAGSYYDQSALLIVPNLGVNENFGSIDSVAFHTSGEVGEMIDGEFYGTLQNADSTWQYDLNYNGRFHIIRTH